jgi:sugar O-acyltransferase (sialic acid O-acetyltransferase NeuD family)
LKEIAIVGAGGCGRELKWLIDEINRHRPEWNFLGYFDDDPSVETFGQPFLGNVEAANHWNRSIYLMLGLGYPEVRKKVAGRLTNINIHYPTLIHPSVQLHPNEVKMGEGSSMSAGCVVTTRIEIGNHVLINPMCSIAHDTTIGHYSSVLAGTHIAGEVVVEAGCFLGLGVKVINRVHIGAYTIVGAGAVVASALPENCTAVGIPAKPIKFRKKDDVQATAETQ